MKRQNMRKALELVSFLLFPITINFLSPYLIIVGGAQGIITGSFIIFSALFLGSTLFGRVFCGWICPAAALQEYCFNINNKKTGKKINKIKYFLWVPWILSILTALVLAGGIKKVDPLFMTETGISVDAPVKYVIYFAVIAVFLILALTLGKRGACHSICWMSPFMVLGSKLGRMLRLPSLHLEAEKDKCNNCRSCESKCPMSIDVSELVQKNDMIHSECILCGECVDTCPKKVIKFHFRNQ